MNRFLSTIQRLRSMSNDEISYRTREACRKQVDRLQFWLRLGRQDHEFDNLLATYRGSLKGYLESVASRRFYPSLFSQNRKDTISLLE